MEPTLIVSLEISFSLSIFHVSLREKQLNSMKIMNINHLQGQNDGNKGRKAQDYTDEVEDKAIKASHAL